MQRFHEGIDLPSNGYVQKDDAGIRRDLDLIVRGDILLFAGGRLYAN